MISRRTIGKLWGSIFSFLDILDYSWLADDYPEALVTWRKNTRFEKIVTYNHVVSHGTKNTEYRVDGKHHHRLNGPATEYGCGHKEWWQNGKLHRTDGPAVEHIDGKKTWYQDGELHRVDGPAVERADGSKEWWQNGVRHQSSTHG